MWLGKGCLPSLCKTPCSTSNTERKAEVYYYRWLEFDWIENHLGGCFDETGVSLSKSVRKFPERVY